MMRKNNLAVSLLSVTLLLASACSALTPDNPAATLQAQRQGYFDEATSIAQAAQAQGTQVQGTAVAAQTYVANVDGRNQQLISTMQIAYPPTQALVVNGGTSTPGQMASPAPLGSVDNGATPPPAQNGGSTQDISASNASLNGAQFTQVGTAASVRSSDGCADALTNSFPADVKIIYITTRGLNVKQGIQMRAEWYYEGQLTDSQSYTIPRDDSDFCMWFSITPTDVSLSSGDWSVKLFANNQSVAPSEVDFTVGK